MNAKSDLFIWGDNWWFENNKAWFVWGVENVLCCVDLVTTRCDLLRYIPDKATSKFRLTPYCIKYQDDIYCMPSYGKSVWVYNTTNYAFDEICIDNPDEISIGIQAFWIYENKIYAVSNDMKQIIEINHYTKKVDNCYQICKKGVLTQSIKVDSFIYSLNGESGEIYQFDLTKKNFRMYKLPQIGKKYFTMCHDGEKFWLSGYCKEVYIWDSLTNKINIVNGFPRDFGIYDFTEETDGKANCIASEYKRFAFIHSVTLGENIWFIPYITNKIIYVNKYTYQIHTFEVNEEDETKESILSRRNLWYKYLLEYVKDERYLGLYSIKNNCMMEIDTVKMTYEYRSYDCKIGNKCVQDYIRIYGNIFGEQISAWRQKVFEIGRAHV